MIKLLKSQFGRLWKNKVLLIFCIVMLIVSLVLVVVRHIRNIKNDAQWVLDDGFFMFGILIIILSSIFTSLFVGTEYSDGTIRNKIIVGQNRRSIYLSNLIVCIVACLLICVAYIIPQLCIGIPLLGFFKAKTGAVVLALLVILLMMMAVVSLFSLIAMLCQNKAVSAIACVLLAFALLFMGFRVINALNEPEYYDGFSITANGTPITEEGKKNPDYLSGGKRDFYEFLKDFIPGAQAIELSSMKIDSFWELAVYDLIILIASTGCGIWIFRKKDLK